MNVQVVELKEVPKVGAVVDELFTPVEASSVIQTIFVVDRATFVVVDFWEYKLRVFTRLDGSKEVS